MSVNSKSIESVLTVVDVHATKGACVPRVTDFVVALFALRGSAVVAVTLAVPIIVGTSIQNIVACKVAESPAARLPIFQGPTVSQARHSPLLSLEQLNRPSIGIGKLQTMPEEVVVVERFLTVT